MILQMIPINDTTRLFIVGFDMETNELKFRVSHNMNHLQTEKVAIDEKNEMIYTNLYHFHISYLYQFLMLNKNEDTTITNIKKTNN